jgi:glycogen debranching enzyme
LNNNGILKQKSVKINNEIEIGYSEWSDKIKNNFENKFWIPLSESDDKNYEIDANWVHRRGIYKDVYKSSYGYTDYQLRPNVCIAMSYAPELFKPENAI